MAINYLDSFKKKLEEIFMMDHAELDFGIYRIMNQKRLEIQAFLNTKLLPRVKAALASADDAAARKRMDEIEAQVGGNIEVLPVGTPMRDEYDRLQASLATSGNAEEMQSQVFSHLVTFFSRYYDGGDFLSKRRYKADTYAIPYNGEEVKLHWANADQYYIKTSEYFRDYTFVLPTSRRKVHFVLKDASTEQNNNRSQNNMERRFALLQPEADEPVVEVTEQGELNIYFTYELMPKSTKQKDLNAAALQGITSLVPGDFAELLTVKAPTTSNANRTLLEKHITDYTAKNSFDYFIHKDLGAFLGRELDFYIKNEVLNIDDLDPKHIAGQLAVVQAIKGVGQKIITMLAQLEDFQKRLWLKKKFVVGCDYCITLDLIDEKFYAEIAANEAQHREWVRLFAIDEIKSNGMFSHGYSEPLTIDFLKENPFLVLDTAFFTAEFKHRLLATFDHLDEQTNGLLINSDNIVPIRLLQEKYSNKINCIHIDPPYNTDTSGFLYKNNYRHSSWMCMMNERISNSLYLLSKDASFICHIDENEYENLFNLFNQYGLKNLGTVVWDKRNPMTGGHGIALQHEYITWFSPSEITISSNTEGARLILNKVQDLIQKYGAVTDALKQEYRQWLNSCEGIEGGERAYSNIDEKGRVYQSVSLRAPEPRTDPKFHKPLIHPITLKPCPVPPNGFSRTPETMAEMVERGDIIFGADESVQPRYKMYLTFDTKKQMTSVISNAVKGKTELTKLGFDFPYCHSTTFYNTILTSCLGSNDFVMDYFAGSGTTGHTIIDINRDTDLPINNLHYILCEVNEYFNSVTKPRIQKVIYASNWNDSKPVSRDGISQCFKYIRLEQYEDTLNNLQLKQQGTLPDGDFGESYMLQYMLDVETRDSLLNLQWFINPFAMTIKTTRDNELVETPVDMVETFNYLIGLDVDTVDWHNDGNICAVTGTTHRGGLKTLVIWRNCEQIDNEALNRFFERMDYRTRDTEFDQIYVNGDNTLPNLRRDEESWKVVLIEEEFLNRMFED